MAGLIENAIKPTQLQGMDTITDKVGLAGSSGFEPEKRTVDTNETVSGQLDSLMKKDNPLMQRAGAHAAQAANKRGLVNSSMGVQAGQAAMIDAALPIAQADANVFNTAKRENQAATNTALQFGADASNRSQLQNADALNSIGKLREAGRIETGMQNLKGEWATNLANIEANYKQLIQTSDSAAKIMQTMSSAMAAIQADLDTSPEQKTAAMTKMAQLLKANLNVVGAIANVDLTGLLNFQG